MDIKILKGIGICGYPLRRNEFKKVCQISNAGEYLLHEIMFHEDETDGEIRRRNAGQGQGF